MEHLDEGMARRLVAGLATDREAAEARSHLVGCEVCQARVQQAADASAATDSSGEPTSLSPLSSSEEPTKVAAVKGAEAWARLPSLNDPEPVLPLPRGTTVGRYLILDPVGQGGMGIVYAAYDPELDRKVALKLLKVSRNPGDDGQARLLREAQAMARISHPNVTAVYDAGTYGDQVFLAMELVEGGKTLRDWLLHERRTWREVLEVMVAAGRGLAAAHAAGLVHRDFKPENVLVGQEGRVQVTDFGLARLARSGGDDADLPPQPHTQPPALTESGLRLRKELTQSGAVVGTPSYMAPEQHQGKPPDARSDQFSFCTTLYFALYQQRAFDPRQLIEAVRDQARAEPSELIQPPPSKPRVPSWVKRALMRGLSLSPEARFASMDALLERLSRPPATARWSWAASVVVLLAGAAALSYREVSLRRTALCSGAGERLQGVWDGRIQGRIQSAFEATGKSYAAFTFQAVRSALEAYARDWAAMHTEACQATRVRGEQTEAIMTLRMTCLDRRLKELGALTALLAKADASTLDRAVDAVARLPGISTCADVDVLSAPVPPPADPATRGEVARLTTQLARAGALRSSGKYEAARDVLEGAVTAARALSYQPLLAEALNDEGATLILLGRGKDAESTLLDAWSAAEAAHHDEVRAKVAAEMLYDLANLQPRLPEALVWARLGEAALVRLGRPPALEMKLRLKLGTAFYKAGQFPQALAQLERALGLAGRAQEGGSVDRPAILTNLSRVHQAQGDYAGALRLQEEATAAYERLQGPDHPNAGLGHNNLADLYFREGELALAIPHARKAVAVLEAALGKEHYWVGSACDTLAGILARQGRYAEALDHAQRALTILEKTLGPEHLLLTGSLDNLGYIYLETGRARQALPLLERALALKNSEPGLLADTRFHTARALMETGGDARRARELAALALEGYRAQGLKDEAGEVERWLRERAR